MAERVQPRGQEQTQQQEQTPEQETRNYEDSPWLNVHDFQVKEHANSETGEKFWSCKLLSGTYLEVDGQRTDVTAYRFHTNVEPAVTFGEPGSPKAMRGIHFPADWDITLTRVENQAPEGVDKPQFAEVDRIEGVTPKELASAIDEREAAWRDSHRKNRGEQAHDAGKDAQNHEQKAHRAHREAEPAL